MAERPITRRSLLKWTAAAGAAGLVGLASSGAVAALADEAEAPAGEWKTGACYNNCSCGASRCLLRVYVEDGVPLKIRTDEAEEDSYALPQRRACVRGRARMSEQQGPARIKYPMKRKNWSPEDPHPELRGRDEWERISWEEALDLIAEQWQKTLDEYGPAGILCAASPNIGDGYYDNNVCLFNALGGAVHHTAGTVSYGAWAVADTHMIGGFLYGATHGPHHNELLQSELHVLFGSNWAANKAGNNAWWLNECRARGAKVIAIDPWLSQTSAAVADEWVPVLPGTDVALIQAICHEWIVNGTYDKEYLDKYCIGFDADTMPEGSRENGSWKDYIMGTSCYDDVEKTPEWAEAICGVPADRIRELAEEIASVDKVDFHAAQSSSKIPAGEQFVQSFYTLALMHGGIGTPGHYFHWRGVTDAMSGALASGNYCPPGVEPVNPFQPLGGPEYMQYPIPNWDVLGEENQQTWLNLEPNECWRSILSGEYGRDIWPGGKRKIDIHQIYFGGSMNTLNQIPDSNGGIKAVRSMDFVWGMNPFFDASRQYCDVVLPCTAWWEKSDKAFTLCDNGSLLWWDKILEPLYEAKDEWWICEQLAERMGVDPKVANPLNEDERRFATVRDATYQDAETFASSPLLTITQEEIDELFPESGGEPQEGVFTFAEFRENGILKYPMTEETPHIEPFSAFYADPEANPLATASGKFEIYCEALEHAINTVGYSTIYPVGVYQVGDPEQGAGQQTDEFPLLLWTPHSLRRAHSPNDNAISLREAHPQECFMSTVDAEARGIANGDTVLMTSPYGKVLRHAKVLPYIVPGAVALQDGAWIQIDEETGIDLGGCPNILQAPKSSGGGTQTWCGTLLQVEKYDGPLTLDPDKDRPIVTPVGVDA